MRRAPAAVSAGVEVRTTHKGPHERLLGFRAQVSDDGDSTSFACQYTHQRPFLCRVGIEEIGPILNEIRSASNIMVNRQRLKLDKGAEKMLGMCANALRPVANDVIIDPATGDRLFILQFADHAPIVIRMSVAEVAIGLHTLEEAVRRSHN